MGATRRGRGNLESLFLRLHSFSEQQIIFVSYQQQRFVRLLAVSLLLFFMLVGCCLFLS